MIQTDMIEQVYIAGPMTGIENLNWPAFDFAASEWRAAGHEVISPAEMDREMGINDTIWQEATSAEKNDLMRKVFSADFTALCQCSAIALLPRWEYSKGAKVELQVARLLRMRVYDAMTGERLRHLEHHEVLYEPASNP